MKIIPSINTDSVFKFMEDFKKCEIIGRAQVDVSDGIFNDHKSLGPETLTGNESYLDLDYHLMVKDPESWLERCTRSGATRVIGHVEMMTSQKEFVGRATSLGLLVGLAIDIQTPVEAIDSYILPDLDVVLVMSVPSGPSFQVFDERCLPKIKKLVSLKETSSTPFSICLDGGVKVEEISNLENLGVDEVVVDVERYLKEYAKD